MHEELRGFLTEIARAINRIPSQVHLYRVDASDGSYQIIKNSCDLDYLKVDFGYGAKLSTYRIMFQDNLIASFCLYEFPSCCAFCVSTQAYTAPKYRQKGINKITNRLRQWIAKLNGYSALICTDVENNIPERKTLSANGFMDIYKIKNQRTKNTVLISVKELN